MCFKNTYINHIISRHVFWSASFWVWVEHANKRSNQTIAEIIRFSLLFFQFSRTVWECDVCWAMNLLWSLLWRCDRETRLRSDECDRSEERKSTMWRRKALAPVEWSKVRPMRRWKRKWKLNVLKCGIADEFVWKIWNESQVTHRHVQWVREE